MSFTINWYVPQQVISLKLEGVITSEEMIQLHREAVEHIQAGQPPIHMVIDTLGITAYPTNLRWLIDLVQGSNAIPSGWMIVVTDNSTIRLLASTLLNMMRIPVHPCLTIEEAHAFLKKQHISPDAPVS